MSHDTTAAKDLVVAQLRAESATCQKATNPSQISSESATPGLRAACSHVKAAFRVFGMSRIRATMAKMGYANGGGE